MNSCLSLGSAFLLDHQPSTMKPISMETKPISMETKHLHCANESSFLRFIKKAISKFPRPATLQPTFTDNTQHSCLMMELVLSCGNTTWPWRPVVGAKSRWRGVSSKILINQPLNRTTFRGTSGTGIIRVYWLAWLRSIRCCSKAWKGSVLVLLPLAGQHQLGST
jgi:hypothetical protein